MLAFPPLSFCQTIETPGEANFAHIVGNSCTRADVEGSVADKSEIAKTTVAESDPDFVKGQCFSAFVDNDRFPLMGYRSVNATLVADGSSLGNGMEARTIININLGGKSDTTIGEDLYPETIRLNLALTEPISPGSASCNVSLNHRSAVYTMLKGDASNVEIIDFVWGMDRKSFILTLKFDCTMRSLGFPADGKSDVNLKGKLVRLHVTAPGVVSASN